MNNQKTSSNKTVPSDNKNQKDSHNEPINQQKVHYFIFYTVDFSILFKNIDDFLAWKLAKSLCVMYKLCDSLTHIPLIAISIESYFWSKV